MKFWTGEASARFWTVIAGIIAVGSLGWAIYIFMHERATNEKALDVQMVAKTRLVDSSVSGSAKGIKVLYAGREVPNYELIQIRVANVGGQPITPSDFVQPLSISLANVTEVLSAEQSASDPPGLAANPQITKDVFYQDSGRVKNNLPPSQTTTITISPLLLNPTDSFTVAIGVVPDSHDTPGISVGGRIVGVKKIEYRSALPTPKPTSTWLESPTAGILIALGAAMFGFFTANLMSSRRAYLELVREIESRNLKLERRMLDEGWSIKKGGES